MSDLKKYHVRGFDEYHESENGFWVKAREAKLKIEKLEAKLSEEEKECEWWADEDEIDDGFDIHYNTKCGHAWILLEGTPEENQISFCNFCGGKLKPTKG